MKPIVYLGVVCYVLAGIVLLRTAGVDIVAGYVGVALALVAPAAAVFASMGQTSSARAFVIGSLVAGLLALQAPVTITRVSEWGTLTCILVLHVTILIGGILGTLTYSMVIDEQEIGTGVADGQADLP